MQHIGRNILSLITSRILAGVVLFFITIRLYGYLGPEVTGQFGLLATYLMVFSFFVDLGMSQLVIKKISEDPAHASKYLNNYFSIQFLLGLGFMIIMDAIVFLSDYPPEVTSALYIAGFALFLSSLSLPFRSVINGFQKLTIIAKVNFCNSIINGSMMVIAIIFRHNLFFLAFISVAVSLFDILVYGYLVNKKFVPVRWEFDWTSVKQLFIWTLPFTLLTFFSIYNRIDALLLPYFRNFIETGYYAAAYKFWDVLAFAPSVIGIALYPFFAERLSKGLKDDVRAGLETYTRYMIAVALPMAVGAYILASRLASLPGEEFKPAAPALWLLVTAVSVLLIYAPANSLVISQQTKTATKITGLTLLLNIILNIILIPRYGFVAAAAVTLLSEVNQAFWYWLLIRKRIINYRFIRYFVKPIIASAMMAVAVFFLRDQNLLLAIGGGGAVYGIALLALRFFHKADWELFRAAVDIRKPVNLETPPS